MVHSPQLKYIKAEAGATEATPQQVGGHARGSCFSQISQRSRAHAPSMRHKLPWSTRSSKG